MTVALTSRAGNVGGIGIDDWEEIRVISSSLVFQAVLSLFFFSSFLIKGHAILEMQEICMQRV